MYYITLILNIYTSFVLYKYIHLNFSLKIDAFGEQDNNISY